jgi:hypothetical protein
MGFGEIHANRGSETSDSGFPETDAERDAVRRQLSRILASERFANSRRYPSLLKYIVEQTLEGRAFDLKERTLGIEVFGRDPAYDTNLDPVVRTSAAQVRHRLAQYYQEAGAQDDIRIDLLPGSYVPLFRPKVGNGNPVANIALPAPSPAMETVPKPARFPPAAPRPRRRIWPWLTLAVACAAVLAAGALARWIISDPVRSFWGPVWSGRDSIVICVPGRFPTPDDPEQTSGVALPVPLPSTPLNILDSLRLNSIAWPDATALYSLVGFLQEHGRAFRVRRERDLPFSDLRLGPVLMVGGYNNQWLMRLTNRYRFTYEEQDGEHWIRDAQNPARRDWKVSLSAPYSSFDLDYGIISRVWDATTEHWIVVASGIASYGTIAAGEFLTSPEYLGMLSRQAPRGWKRKNLQVVFETRVFNGNAGPPRILAIHVW